MTTVTIKNEFIEQLGRLPAELQLQALQFVRALGVSKQSSGISGKSLTTFAGCIPVADLQQISSTIQEGCEQVDVDEW
jgi:hypothetical protein